jgi:tetratricopeptide (TPR) repeat protein
MKEAAVIFCALTAAIPGFSACAFSAAEAQVYRRATDPQLPFGERREAFRESIAAWPQDAALYTAYASFLIASHDFNEALPAIERGLKIAPQSVILHLRQGEALIALGDAPRGLTALDKAGTDKESQFFRGLGYQLLGDHSRARDYFLDAWKRGNDDPYVLYSLVREDKELDDKSAGLEHFRLLITRFPRSPWVHVLLGDAHFQKGEDAQAREEYLQALKSSPDLFEANFRLAYLAFEAGQNSSAIAYYRAALAVKPHHTEANVYLGEALRRERQLPEAIAQLQRAVAIDPSSELAYDSLSKALADDNRLADAAKVLSDAGKRFPNNSSFPAMRSRILTRLGRTEEARRDASRAAALIAEKNQRDSLAHP